MAGWPGAAPVGQDRRKRPSEEEQRRSNVITHPHVRPLDADAYVAAVVASLDDDKAEDVIVIDLRGRSTIADFMVIATGRSHRQLNAMAEHLGEKLKRLGVGPSFEGMGQGDWVLIDARDIVVHLFRPEVRAFYNLERMWSERAPGQDAGVLTA